MTPKNAPLRGYQIWSSTIHNELLGQGPLLAIDQQKFVAPTRPRDPDSLKPTNQRFAQPHSTNFKKLDFSVRRDTNLIRGALVRQIDISMDTGTTHFRRPIQLPFCSVTISFAGFREQCISQRHCLHMPRSSRYFSS